MYASAHTRVVGGVVVEFREQTPGVIPQVPFIAVVVDTGTLIGPELTKQAKLTAQ